MKIESSSVLADAVARELAARAIPMELILRPESVLRIAGLLQLASRHPQIDGSSLETIKTFLAGARAYFGAECPAVLELLAAGDDPANDR